MWFNNNKIIITKSSILDYSKNHNNFTIEDILNYYYYIHKAEKNKDIKETIKKQIYTKLYILIKKDFIKKIRKIDKRR